MDAGREQNERAIVNGARHAGEGEYDALAELFLGEGAPADPTGGEQSVESAEDADRTAAEEPQAVAERPRIDSAAPEIEALVLGHLPVLAGAWALAYCGEKSEESGEVMGLLRLTAGRAAVDIFGAEHISCISSAGTCATVEEALGLSAGAVDRWVVRVDATDEPQIAAAPGVDAVTLLCGADEAATVAAYRTIKSLGSMLDEGMGASSERPRTLRAAVMGAEPEKAERAGRKLRQATQAFLDRPLQLTAPVQRIGGSRPAHLFDGQVELDALELLSLLGAALEAPLRSEQIGRAHV